MLAIKATVEHQEEVIRLLRENLRRNQQAQDTSSKWKRTDDGDDVDYDGGGGDLLYSASQLQFPLPPPSSPQQQQPPSPPPSPTHFPSEKSRPPRISAKYTIASYNKTKAG